MKLKGIWSVFATLVVVVFANQSRADLTCEGLLFKSLNIKAASESQFLANYKDVAQELQKRNIPADKLFPSQSLDFFNDAKIRFLTKKAADIQKILSGQEVTMEEIVFARLYTAEEVLEHYSKPYAYVLLIDGKVFSFPFNAGGFEIVNKQHVGFMQKINPRFLRLNRDWNLQISSAGEPMLYPASAKDPIALRKLVKENQVPEAFKKAYALYADQFTSILLKTDLTIGELIKADFESATVTGSSDTITLFKTNDRAFYLTPRRGLIDKDDKDRWGEFSFDKSMGYSHDDPKKIKFSNGKEFTIRGNEFVDAPKADLTNDALFSRNLVDDNKMSLYRRTFLEKYQQVLEDLIKQNSFFSTDLRSVIYTLEVAISTTNSTKEIYVLRGRRGYYYFEKDSNQWGLLSEISQDRFGKLFYISDGRVVHLKQLSGFLNRGYDQVIETIPVDGSAGSQDVIWRQKSYFSKIQVAMGKEELTNQQIGVLVTVQSMIQSSGINMADRSLIDPDHLVNLATQIKRYMINDGVFSLREADEFIKTTF